MQSTGLIITTRAKQGDMASAAPDAPAAGPAAANLSDPEEGVAVPRTPPPRGSASRRAHAAALSAHAALADHSDVGGTESDPAAAGPPIARLKTSRRESRPSRGERPSITGNEVPMNDATQVIKTVSSEARRDITDSEVLNVISMLREAIALRDKYRTPTDREDGMRSMEEATPSEEPPAPFDPFVAPPFAGKHYSFEVRRGVVQVWSERSASESGRRKPGAAREGQPLAFEPPPSMSSYTRDLGRLLAITSDAAVNSWWSLTHNPNP